jgi:hypothetical protein
MIRQLAKASVLPDVHLSRTPNHTRIIAEYHSFLLFNLQKKKQATLHGHSVTQRYAITSYHSQFSTSIGAVETLIHRPRQTRQATSDIRLRRRVCPASAFTSRLGHGHGDTDMDDRAADR